MTNEEKLRKLNTFSKNKDLAVFNELQDIAERLGGLSHAEMVKIKGDKGEQGIQGEKGEKGDKGDKGEDGVSIKGDKGDAGKDGKNGKNGIDGKDGTNGINGKNGKNGIDGSPDTGIEIKDKLESLKGKDKLDYSALKNAPDITSALSKIGRGGSNIEAFVNGTKIGSGSKLDLVGTGVTATNDGSKTTYTIAGGAGGQVNTVVAGTGISINSTDPVNPIVTNTAPDQIVAIIGSGAAIVTGTYPNFNVDVSGAGGDMLISVYDPTHIGADVFDYNNFYNTPTIPVLPTFKTNGVTNPDQTLLNLIAGTNMTITDDGFGGITIDATGGGGTPSLTATQIAFGDGSNLMTSSSSLTYDDTNKLLTSSGAILSAGTYGAGWTEPDLGAGTRMLWYPKKGALRVGTASGTTWNDANIGDYSVALGNNSKADGYGAFAFGINGVQSNGDVSIAMGNVAKATANGAVAIGNGPQATAVNAVAIGYGGIASGNNSTAFGDYTKAESFDTTVIGRYNNGGGTAGSWVDTDSIFEIGIGASAGVKANALTVFKNGKIRFDTYGVGTFTGTPTYNLSVDASGNIIETSGGGGTGDVVGPASAVDGNVALFDGITGKLIKDGGTLGTGAFATIGNYVPYTGATAYLDLGTQGINAISYFFNPTPVASTDIISGSTPLILDNTGNDMAIMAANGNGAGNGGNLTIGAGTGANSGKVGIVNSATANGFRAFFDTGTLSTDKNFAFPDADGTLALTSDLGSYVPYSGATALVDLGAFGLSTTSDVTTPSVTGVIGSTLVIRASDENGVNIQGGTGTILNGGIVSINSGNAAAGNGGNGGDIWFLQGLGDGAGTAGKFLFSPNGSPANWGELDFSSINTSQKTFTFPNESGVVLLDAPSDGIIYGRQNATWVAVASGAGDVIGPASAVDSNFAAFDTTTGKLIKDSGFNSTSFATFAQGALADTALQNISGQDLSTADNTTSMFTTLADVALVGYLTSLGFTFVDNETPSGTIDGTNADFTLAHTPISNSEHVYKNGVRMKLTVDYTIATNTITFVVPPTLLSELVVDYRF